MRSDSIEEELEARCTHCERVRKWLMRTPADAKTEAIEEGWSRTSDGWLCPEHASRFKEEMG